jgi:hypothetical protein
VVAGALVAGALVAGALVAGELVGGELVGGAPAPALVPADPGPDPLVFVPAAVAGAVVGAAVVGPAFGGAAVVGVGLAGGAETALLGDTGRVPHAATIRANATVPNPAIQLTRALSPF